VSLSVHIVSLSVHLCACDDYEFNFVCLVRGNMPPRAPRPPRGPREHFFACAELNLEFYFLCGVLYVLTVEINICKYCADVSCCLYL